MTWTDALMRVLGETYPLNPQLAHSEIWLVAEGSTGGETEKCVYRLLCSLGAEEVA